MARARSNGNGHLEESLNSLIQAQALLVQNQAAYLAQKGESDKRLAENEKEVAEFRRRSDDWQRDSRERFERIERILIEHTRILRALPEAVREKIGFKPTDAKGPTS